MDLWPRLLLGWWREHLDIQMIFLFPAAVHTCCLPTAFKCSPVTHFVCWFLLNVFCSLRTLHFVTHRALCCATADMCHWCIFTPAFVPSTVSDAADSVFGLTLWFYFFFRLGLQIIKGIMSNILHAYGFAEIFVLWSIRRHTHMQPLYADFVTLHALIIG